MKRLPAVAALAALLALPAAAEPVKMIHEPLIHSSPAGGELKARLLRPEAGGQNLPLVVLLHGAGERGGDNEIQLKHGAPPLMAWLEKNQQPAYALFPQCPTDHKWIDVDWSAPRHTFSAEPTAELRMVLEVVDGLVADGRVDPDRVYIGGLSMGGFGTWDMLAREPKRFAAGFPICGGGDPDTVARFTSVPVRVFHGTKDTVVKPSRSTEMVSALQAAGGKVEYTEYPDLAHDSWTRTLANEDFWAWLFAQKRAPALGTP